MSLWSLWDSRPYRGHMSTTHQFISRPNLWASKCFPQLHQYTRCLLRKPLQSGIEIAHTYHTRIVIPFLVSHHKITLICLDLWNSLLPTFSTPTTRIRLGEFKPRPKEPLVSSVSQLNSKFDSTPTNQKMMKPRLAQITQQVSHLSPPQGHLPSQPKQILREKWMLSH